MRRVAHIMLVLALATSLILTLRAGWQIAANPALSPLIDRTAAEIFAATDRMMARRATPARITALIDARLAETPRNWIALEALAAEATARGITLPPGYGPALDEDQGLIALSADCVACAWDIAACTLSTALICKAPILLTPVEDLRGVVKAGADYSLGQPIDRLDLGLSVVGLAATAAILASGGSSGLVKAGTATIKLARGMGRLSPTLTRGLTAAVTDGIRWADLPGVRRVDDLAAVVRVDALAPLADTARDLGRMAEATGPARALHLLPLVDDATDARRLAAVTEAVGPRAVAQAEVLGKQRFLRAAVRISDTALGLIVGLVGALISAALMLGGMLQTWVLRRLRAATA